MKAELISIGDELLIGQTINTNAAWLGQQLSLMGIPVRQNVTITDTEQAIHDAIKEGFDKADLLILTGGLGPTKDDITKKVIADFFNVQLVLHQDTLDRVEGFFKERNRPMLEVNKQQAYVPEGCTVLTNNNGTAPGMWMEFNGKVLISLPGVPYEMKAIMQDGGFNALKEVFPVNELYYKTILTQGIGESYLADQMQDWENKIRAAGFGLAYLPSPGQVRIRISSPRGQVDDAFIDGFFAELMEVFPKHVYGFGDVSLSEVVGGILREQKVTLGTAESCTSGALANAIVSISGASDYFEGSFITYSNRLKHEQLGVPLKVLEEKGAVSEEVVKIMAKNAREKLGVDYCLSVSGIAGPTGGTEEKPVGTVWIGLASETDVRGFKFYFGNNRDRNILLTVLSALNLLRCELLKV